MSTTITLPESLKISVAAKWRENEQFFFKLFLSNGEKQMPVEYSGGCRAFVSDKGQRTYNAIMAQQHKGNRNSLHNARVRANAVDALFQDATPKLEQVLNSLLSDARAGEMPFDDFCCDFGYDTDSRKALETYLACQKINSDLQSVMPRQMREEIETLLQDY